MTIHSRWRWKENDNRDNFSAHQRRERLGDTILNNNDKEPGTRNQEQGTRNKEPGTKNQEQRTRNKEPGTKNQEQGARNKEPGTKTKQ